MNEAMFTTAKAELSAEIEAIQKAIAEQQAAVLEKEAELRILDRLQAKYFPAPVEAAPPEAVTTDEVREE